MNHNGEFEQIEPLTERERDVLELLVLGKTDQQIADTLVLSINTVKWYNRQIYGKLGVENRVEAAEQARGLGLVKGDDAWERPTYHLPHPATSLLGRERELEELESLLLDGRTRIVSIIGPGGMGKTRLAIELAHKLNGRFADGVAFVSLAPLQSEDSVVPAIAQSLRFTFQGGGLDEKSQLLNFLSEKKLLIVLDNYEHLIDSAPLLTEIAETAPQLKMVVTSREKLKLQIEQLYPLQSLPLMDWESVEKAEQDPVVQLFMDYGRRVRPNFELKTEELDPLRQILILIDGMPLAIILASAWLELLTLGEVAAEIQKNIDFLEADYQDLPDRQRSMRVVFEASWNQLNEEKQKVFSELSVFRGGFTLDAAREVIGATPGILLGLVSRSLLNRDENGRFEIHELLRQFGLERIIIENTNSENDIHKLHSIYYCGFLQKREDALSGHGREQAELEIAAEIENINMAWRWAAIHMENLIFQAQTALGIFCQRNYRFEAGKTAFLFALKQLDSRVSLPTKNLAELLAWASYFIGKESKEMAETLIQRAFDYIYQLENRDENIRPEKAFVLLIQSYIPNPLEMQTKWLEESINLYKTLQKPRQLAWAHRVFGETLIRRGIYQQANEQHQQALLLYEQVGDHLWVNRTNLYIARNLALLGNASEAEKLIRKTTLNIEKNGDLLSTFIGRHKLGEVLIYCGRFDEAISPLHESQAMFRRLGVINRRMSCISHLCLANLHLGNYDNAANEAHLLEDNSQALGIRVSDYQAIVDFIQGSISLALKRPEEAEIAFTQSLTNFRKVYASTEVGWALSCLAYAALQTGNLASAQQYLVEALQYRTFMSTLFALVASALLLGSVGQVEQAIEIYALAQKHRFVSHSHWLNEIAGNKIEVFSTTLSAEKAEAAHNRGRGLDLWETAESLLQELTPK